MRLRTLLLLLVACLSSFGQSQRSSKKTDQAQTSQNASKIDFWFIAASPDLNPTNEQEATHDKPDYGDLATWMLVFVGIAGTFAALRTLSVIRRQTKAIERQGDALINSEQSWVIVDVNPKARPVVGAFILSFWVWNAGKTPARMIHTISEYKLVPAMDQLPPVPAYGNPGTDDQSMLAPASPGAVGTFNIAMVVQLNAATFNNVQSGQIILYAHGKVRYTSFGVNRYTAFGFRWIPPAVGQPFANRWVRDGPKGYNENT